MEDVFIIETASENQAVISLNSKLLQKGIIMIDGDIDSAMESKVKSQILYLMNTNKQKKIIIYISSYGGSVYSGLAIYDMIELAKRKGFQVETVCTGIAMSMGLVLLSSGTKGLRKSMSNSTIMGHNIQSGLSYSPYPDYKINFEESTRLNNLLMSIIEKNTNIKKASKFFERDKYLTSEESIKLGIIDLIC